MAHLDGHSFATINLAKMYFFGIGVQKNEQRAVELMHLVAPENTSEEEENSENLTEKIVKMLRTLLLFGYFFSYSFFDFFQGESSSEREINSSLDSPLKEIKIGIYEVAAQCFDKLNLMVQGKEKLAQKNAASCFYRC